MSSSSQHLDGRDKCHDDFSIGKNAHMIGQCFCFLCTTVPSRSIKDRCRRQIPSPCPLSADNRNGDIESDSPSSPLSADFTCRLHREPYATCHTLHDLTPMHISTPRAATCLAASGLMSLKRTPVMTRPSILGSSRPGSVRVVERGAIFSVGRNVNGMQCRRPGALPLRFRRCARRRRRGRPDLSLIHISEPTRPY